MRYRFLFLALPLTIACGGKSTERVPDPSWGAPCATGEDCVGGTLCISDSHFPGGYCTADCSTTECAEGARCTPAVGLDLCFASCADESDCRDGYDCWLGTCRPPCESGADCGTAGATCMAGRCAGPECTTDAECGPGLRCSGTHCVAPPPDGGGSLDIGQPCTRSPECITGICLPPALGGTCALGCTDRNACGAFELACSPIPWDADGDGAAELITGACITGDEGASFLGGRCGADPDCEARACVDGECTEVCDDVTDCIAGMACVNRTRAGAADGTFLGCGYADRATTGDVYDIDLGTHTLSTGSVTSRIRWAVPPDSVSSTLIGHQASGELLPISFVEVFDPDALQIFSYADLVAWLDPPERWLPFDTEESIAMLVPNTTPDRLLYVTGRYGVTLAALSRMEGDIASADVSLRVRVKRGDPDGSAQRLDLNVFLVGIGLTAETARTNSRLQAALTEVDRILGARNVRIGTTEYIQITGTDATRYSVIDSSDGPDSEMSQLLRLGASRTNDALDVFFVRGITSGGEGGIALGIAGGIPGPPGLHGTMHSGVLVSFDTMVVGDDPRVVAQIASHEMGHFLGLFHNRENGRPCAPGTGPTMADPCAPFGGGDTLADTERLDGTNLMWYALGGADGRTYNVELSDGQGFVLRRNPLTH